MDELYGKYEVTFSARMDPLVTEVAETASMAKSDNPFRWFDSSPELIPMIMMLCVRF